MAEINPYEAPQLDFKDRPQLQVTCQRQKNIALLIAIVFQVLALAATVLSWLSSALAVWGKDIRRHDRNTLIATGVAAVLTGIVIILAGRKGKQTLVFFEGGILGMLLFYLLALIVN